ATKNVAAEDRDPASLLNHYRRLIHFRNAHSALTSGDLSIDTASAGTVATFLRRSPDETILLALNFGDRAVDRYRVGMTPAVGGHQRFRMRQLYADPVNGCVDGTISPDGRSILPGSIAAHGFCAFLLQLY
ncbi:MAG: DUF3459 domain-containing protein, partial [Gemmatimonadales bacterium]